MVQQRIEEMSMGIFRKVINEYYRSEKGIAIPVDESSDVNFARLLIFPSILETKAFRRVLDE